MPRISLLLANEVGLGKEEGFHALGIRDELFGNRFDFVE